jgi:hypothetical protein
VGQPHGIEGKVVRRISTWTWISSGVFLYIFFAMIGITVISERIGSKRPTPLYALNVAKTSHRPYTLSPVFNLPSIVLSTRTLFPYSVIPGGVESAGELKNALAHDAVAADHYQGFDLAKAHVVRLDHDRALYVSYRLSDRVYWTKNRLTLHRGETLITDGTNEARTRCGNRVSDLAVGPASGAEPSEQALEALPAPELLADNAVPFEIAPTSPGVPTSLAGSPPEPPSSSARPTIIPSPVFPVVGGGPSPTPATPGSPISPVAPPPVAPPPVAPPPVAPPPVAPPPVVLPPPVGPPPPVVLLPPVGPPPPVNTPEPGTLPLLLTGILALGLLGRIALIGQKRKA